MIGSYADEHDGSFGADSPGPCLPHASIAPGPDTIDPLASGYRPDKPIVGFAQLHALGTGGNPSYGNFLLNARVGLCVEEELNASEKRNEKAQAFRYQVDLIQSGVRVELVPSEHSVLYRITYPKGTDSYLTMDVARKVGGEVALDEGSVHVDVKNRTVTGGGRYSLNYNPVPYQTYFAMSVSRPILEAGTWKSNDIAVGKLDTGGRGRSLGAFLRFDTTKEQVIYVKIAVSFSSVANATRYLNSEIPGWDIELLQERAKQEWNKHLEKVDLIGSTPSESRLFYTALCHSLIQPRNRTGDISGFHPEDQLWDDHYTLWDTWQTLFPLLAIVDPDAVRDNINSFISRYRRNDNHYVCEAFIQGKEFKIGQGGNEVDNVIADAFVKRIPGVDWREAYNIVKFDADHVRTPFYRTKGWMASDEKTDYSYRIRSGSATLAFAYNDYLAGQMAAALGYTEDAERFALRSRNWRNVWDPDLSSDGFRGFARARSSNGKFSSTPATKGYNTDFYEGTCWEYSFSVPHDLDGLVASMGGRKVFIDRLVHALDSGYIDFTNEPSFRIPWLFDAVGLPALASHWADVFRKKYTALNLPGDDDSGAMSSLYIFLTAGIFPIAGQNLYYLHGTRVPLIKFHLANGNTFTISGEGCGEDSPYIQSATLNGRPLNTPSITHDDILAGSTLHFVMGPKPSSWGTLPSKQQ